MWYSYKNVQIFFTSNVEWLRRCSRWQTTRWCGSCPPNTRHFLVWHAECSREYARLQWNVVFATGKKLGASYILFSIVWIFILCNTSTGPCFLWQLYWGIVFVISCWCYRVFHFSVGVIVVSKFLCWELYVEVVPIVDVWNRESTAILKLVAVKLVVRDGVRRLLTIVAITIIKREIVVPWQPWCYIPTYLDTSSLILIK